MTKIQKPLLAGKFEPNKAKFPYIATPKDCEYSHITQELIEETAELIRGVYD
jgi:hypothetical protein